MKRFLKFILLLLPILWAHNLHAKLKGQAKTDSLLQELPKAKGDTNNVILLAAISNAYRRSNYEEAVKYGKQAVALAVKLDMATGISTTNYFLGNIYSDHSDFGNALKCFYRSLEIEQQGGDKTAIASLLNNIAAVYSSLADYPKALEINLKALKLFEELGDKNGTANCHINIGGIYAPLSELGNAVKHFQMALELYTDINTKIGMALALNNMADAYGEQKDYDNALKNFMKALEYYQEENYNDGIDMALSNIAGVYTKKYDYKQALDYGFRALKIARDNQLMDGIGYDYKVISEAYFGIATNDSAKKKIGPPAINTATALKQAKVYIDSSIAVFNGIGELNEIATATELASRIDYASGNYKEAYKSYELYKKLNDSIFNLEKDKKLTQSAMQYDFDKKEAAQKAAQDKKDIMQRNIRNSTMAGLAGALIFLVVVYRQRNRVKKEKANVEKEKARSEELLLNILPEEVAAELKAKGSADAKLIDEVTVLFTDFKGFTQLSEKLSPKELVAEINECFSAFDNIMQKHGVEKIKTIGDAYMAAGGLPVANDTHALDVVAAALEIQGFMQTHKSDRQAAGKLFFEIRIGVHTGPVVAGIVGIKKFQYDIWGDTVNTASRMESSGEAGKVNISETTYQLVKDKYQCEYRGEVEAKGKGVMKMYFVG